MGHLTFMRRTQCQTWAPDQSLIQTSPKRHGQKYPKSKNMCAAINTVLWTPQHLLWVSIKTFLEHVVFLCVATLMFWAFVSILQLTFIDFLSSSFFRALCIHLSSSPSAFWLRLISILTFMQVGGTFFLQDKIATAYLILQQDFGKDWKKVWEKSVRWNLICFFEFIVIFSICNCTVNRLHERNVKIRQL